MDLADDLAEFIERKPAWVGPDGLPLSWPHYVIGSEQIMREHSRESLRRFWTINTARSADKGAREDWTSLHRRIAGWGG